MQVSVVVLLLLASSFSASGSKSCYIAYLGGRRFFDDELSLVSSHYTLLSSVLKSVEDAQDSILYSYTRTLNGFAAVLSEEQAEALSKLPGVVSVFPNRRNKLHTTRSWQFMGLESQAQEIPSDSLWNKSSYGKDVIIGSLDTGVWPEAESFKDDSFDSVPEKWNGTCVNGTAFNSSNCNRKLIGARFYVKGYEVENGPLNMTATGDFRSPRDRDGHGTHTSSTAAGSFVPGANILGYANGTAKGGAPLARIAIYKVCWPRPWTGDNECYDADILAALDDAIQDGVDILTLSLGGSLPAPQLFEDAVAIGAFHAMQKGLLVVCSAGNSGPKYGSVVNLAPWILTVAASSIDRSFESSVILGNNATYKGTSLSDLKLNGSSYALVSAGTISATSANSSDSLLCKNGTLDPAKARGNIVACLRGGNSRVAKGYAVLQAGGAGMILANSPLEGAELVADAQILPAAQVDSKSGSAIFSYINSTNSPTAYITTASTVLGVKPAPVMASFSAQGPSTLIPDILKPDITAPGLNILAAFTRASSPTGTASDKRVVKFNMASGTSMACPHVAGVAALLRALHPEWSPAAIKSAIMTSANVHDNRGQLMLTGDLQLAGPFNYGSGHIDPNAAANPGLVYDLGTQDYVLFLCSLGYSRASMKAITGVDYNCPSNVPAVYSLNYPTMTISNLNGSTTLTRTVTNVATAGLSTYRAFVKAPAGVSVSVRPSKMTFSSFGQRQSYNVHFAVEQPSGGKYVFGYVLWSDGKHQVRSSISVNAVAVAAADAAEEAQAQVYTM